MPTSADFFFYGTLRDPAVRACVMGPDGRLAKTQPAQLDGYRCAPVEGGRYPVIVPDGGHSAAGLLVTGVRLSAAARLSYFEGEGHDYDVASCRVTVGNGDRRAVREAPAWVFVPRPTLTVEAGTWDLTHWRRTHRAGFLAGAQRAMAGFDGQVRARYEQAWRARLAPAASARGPAD